jgi:formylglycine-generating enzyme required for sulfatase activity
MLGNVGEWTGDWYATYPGPVTDPTGTTTGSDRVFRGASGSDIARSVRAAARASGTPGIRSNYLGLRLARTAP